MIDNPNDTDSLNNLLDNFEKQKSINTQQDWEKVRKRIESDRNRSVFLRFIQMTAAIILPLFLVWQYVLVPQIEKNNPVTVSSSQYGISKVILSDGSEVWLNASSKITYPQEFKRKSRWVELDGEAYFKVKADKKRPFNVSVNNNMVVSAYGTEFNVNGFTNSDNYNVILTNGSVEVSLPAADKSTHLQPRQQAHIKTATNEIYINEADVYLQTAWKDGKIIFNREKFRSIANRLSQRFDVIFVFADKTIEEQQYTGTFTTESVTEILDLLKQSAPIDYTVKYSDSGSTFGDRKRIITIHTR